MIYAGGVFVSVINFFDAEAIQEGQKRFMLGQLIFKVHALVL